MGAIAAYLALESTEFEQVMIDIVRYHCTYDMF